MPEPSRERPSNGGRVFSIASSAFAIFLFWASLYTYVPTLPTYARSLGATEMQIGWILSSYGLTQLLFRLPLGLLSDRLHRKKVFALLGALLVAASGLGLASARSPGALFAFRALSGCAATTWVTITVLYNSHFSIEQAARTSGQLNFLSAIGQILAMSGGGLIADRMGPRAVFWFSVVIAVPTLAAFAVVRDVRMVRGQQVTLAQLGRAVSTPRLLLVSALAACSQYAMFATTLGFAAVYAQDLGASDAQLSLLVTAVQIAKAIPMFLLSVRRKPQNGRGLTIVGLITMAVPLFIFPLLRKFSLLVACQALVGLGVGTVFPVLMGLALQAVEPEARASAMGAFQSIYALGMTLGPAVSGIFARRWGIPGVYVTNGALLVLAAVVAVLFLREQKQALTTKPVQA